MRLIYAKSVQGNFGDDINPQLWSEVFPSLFDRDDTSVGFVGVGTIIGLRAPGFDQLHVFSSGVGYDALSNWRGTPAEYWCVRGALSAAALGLPAGRAVGDGAYLCPLTEVFAPAAPHGLGAATVVIPHVGSLGFGGWEETCRLLGFTLLDPRGPPAQIIRAIAGAGRVLTESLHGAIVADAYGTPWTVFGCSQNFNALKWADWFSTLAVRPAVHAAPPPTSRIAARYGRVSRPLDDQIAEHISGSAMPGLEARGWAPGGRLRTRLKTLLTDLPGADTLLGYSPERTAAALEAIARRDPCLSPRAAVEGIQTRLLERASAFAAATGAALGQQFQSA